MRISIRQFLAVELLVIVTMIAIAAAWHLGVSSEAGGLILAMAQATPAGARIIDPILTTVAQGYRNNEFVGDELFPPVPVDQRGGKILSFGREDFELYATGRAPGANTKRVQFGYAGAPYALEDHSLEGVAPTELMQEAEAVPGIPLGQMTARKTQNIINLRKEFAQAALATTAANFPAGNKATLAGGDQWSHADSDPSADVEVAKEVIRAKIGRRPNVMTIGPAVMAKLRAHPRLIDRIKYTSRDSMTVELLAELWGLKRVRVGEAVYRTNAGVQTDVWGKFAVLAYTETAGAADMGLPSFGYTYQLRGHPFVEPPYHDRNAKSWIYPVTDCLQPVIACADAGYLFSAAVA